jgi:hypothetical protein
MGLGVTSYGTYLDPLVSIFCFKGQPRLLNDWLSAEN